MKNRTSLLAATAALAAALALPAMAQSPAQDAAAQSGSSAASATSAQSSGASSGGGQTWASVDTDSDGTINKQEAQVNAGLVQIYDQADGNTDGKLTTDEYKAFVAKQQSGGAATGSQGN
ncbi:EF-hand domain-containing protein [Xanthomonas fragariae]|uniref:EF hand n=1 Tax=Xanthomonas fragariae TaxID=48664 RepID=A0A1Y6H200_9XANT|nr:hypothetical protein [Xanthomonas fragariae]AOD16241.1 hypothetical protein BER92_18150 [Xanthomonas fragariae]AOD19672.1 hypothetical protein BER93_18205 [Xanthomonas fragariae]ENZ95512.1 EF hand domain-containing protein [Xanthomonas fragariae LMG 25863]MBL9197089.1 EF-hand domain-containing protein [Xanthomonas fragariae]MBL9222040.1 EF-hand domain-containing protein [Xanthomonas fragariae]